VTIRAAVVVGAAVLVGEYLVVTVLFDATPSSPSLSWLPGGLGFVVPCVVTVGSAAYVLVRPAAREHEQPGAIALAPRHWLPIGAIHACVFATFLWVTRRLFTPGASSGPHDIALLATWAFLGIATVLSLAAAVFRPASLVAFVWRKRALLLAAIAIGIIAFGVGRAAEHLWGPLGAWTLSCVGFVLRPVLPGLVVVPEQLAVGTRQFMVTIAPVCSGLEGIGLISAFVAVYLATARDRIALPAGLVLFPMGIAAAWSANVLRIAVLIWVGSTWSASLAAGGLHSKIGWLLFCAVAVGVVFFANHTALLRRGPVAEPGPNPVAGHLLPFVSLAAATFIAAIPEDGQNALRPLRLIAVALALWFSGGDRPALRFSRSWYPLALGAGAFLLAIGLERLIPTGWTATSLAGAIPPHGVGTTLWILDLVTLVVAIPIACELAFRGYLLRRLASRSFTDVDPRDTGWIALIVSAAAYAAVSGAFWTRWPAGLLYGLAYRRRGRLGDAVLAHAVANALFVAFSILTAAPSS